MNSKLCPQWKKWDKWEGLTWCVGLWSLLHLESCCADSGRSLDLSEPQFAVSAKWDISCAWHIVGASKTPLMFMEKAD